MLAACAGGGGGGGAPVALGGSPGITLESANGAVQVGLTPVPDAIGYELFWSIVPGIDPAMHTPVVVPYVPFTIPDIPGGTLLWVTARAVFEEGPGPLSPEQSVVVASDGPEKYFPSWHTVTPSRLIRFPYDPGMSQSANGDALEYAMENLQAGDLLEIGGGTWRIDGNLRLNIQGTASNPIWIVAKAGETPVITRSNFSQNTVNMGPYGSGAFTEYVLLRGLEITGGDIGLRMHRTRQVWIDQCEIHHTNANAIAANTDDVEYLYFTRNEVHHTDGAGEGFYLGANYSASVMSNSIVALNHVHDTGGYQGDGIEVKQGSWGNWIAENVVHDTIYPCILVYGTDGNAPNVIERNVCWNAVDNVMQVQGEAVVRNNLLMNGSIGLFSGDHQGSTRDLTIVHNTIINSQTAVRLNHWDGRPGMVFANNACYSQVAQGLWFLTGSTGVTVAGNVVAGQVIGTASGYRTGAGLTDFASVSWDATQRDATPHPLGALVAAGHPAFAAAADLTGEARTAPYESGALDLP
jgi:hypothetical protein